MRVILSDTSKFLTHIKNMSSMLQVYDHMKVKTTTHGRCSKKTIELCLIPYELVKVLKKVSLIGEYILEKILEKD